jgi:aminopeptidase N
MSLKFNANIAAAILALMTTFLSEAAIADQEEFQLRREQQLRSHDFDVKHYRIALSLDEPTKSFDGETAVTFSSTINGLNGLTLDTESFTVHSVTHQGAPLTFAQEEGSLTITLDRALSLGEEATLAIGYSVTNIDVDSAKYGMGTNYDLGFNFKQESPTNPPIIFTLSFPEGARHWFPSFDHPSDWATHETIVSLREDYRVVANGALISDRIDRGTGRRTVHWSQTKPQPTYLYVMVAGNHSVLDDKHGDLPLHYWVYPGDEADARLSFGPTPGMIAFFEDLYGVRYPWVKYDQIVIPGIGGGAESTSATVISEWTVKSAAELEDETPDALIAHELAHQWWGDMIGYKDWEHMWLSESFATHAEYLYAMHDLGADEASLTLYQQKAAYLREARTKFIRPVVTNKWNRPNDMFDRHTYEKGGVVLNMFRELVGEEIFRKVLRTFLEKHAYSNATTTDFFDTVRQVTGDNYNWFFDQWLLKPGHPVLDVSHSWDSTENVLSMTIRQTQDRKLGTPVYRLPIRLGITTKTGQTIESFWLNKEQQTFTFEVSEEPLMVHFDEGDNLLKEWTFDKSTRELLYQLSHDKAMGRLWAVGELQERMEDPAVQSALVDSTGNDMFWAVRERAIQAIGTMQSDAITRALESRAHEDAHSHVRAAALMALGAYDDKRFAAFFLDRYEAEDSFLAKAAAVTALGRYEDPTLKSFFQEAIVASPPRGPLETAARAALDSLASP